MKKEKLIKANSISKEIEGIKVELTRWAMIKYSQGKSTITIDGNNLYYLNIDSFDSFKSVNIRDLEIKLKQLENEFEEL